MIYWYSPGLDEFRELPWDEYWAVGQGVVVPPDHAYSFILNRILYTAFPRSLPLPFPGWTA